MVRRASRSRAPSAAASLRVLRERAGDFDVVHDNQSLGSALLGLEAATGLPLVVSIHHPISIDRRIDLESAATWQQAAVGAPVVRLRPDAGAGRPSDADGAGAVGVVAARRRPRVRRRRRAGAGRPPRRRRRLRAARRSRGCRAGSWRWPAPTRRAKGISTLLEAFAKLRTERPELELVLVTRPVAGGRTDQLLDALAIRDHVRFVHGLSDAELVTLMGSAEVACVPSLYEGFSLPDRGADGHGHPARRVAGRARSPRWSAPTGCAPTWSPPATWASWRPRSPRCSTTRSGAPATARPGVAGSRSCSAGGPSRPPPPRRTPRRSRTHRRTRAHR